MYIDNEPLQIRRITRTLDIIYIYIYICIIGRILKGTVYMLTIVYRRTNKYVTCHYDVQSMIKVSIIKGLYRNYIILLYYIILYCIVLYYIILYYITLYYICIILYYIILNT